LRAEIPGGTHHELHPRHLCATGLAARVWPPRNSFFLRFAQQISPGRPSVRLSLVDHPSPPNPPILSLSCLASTFQPTSHRTLPRCAHRSIFVDLTRLSHNDEIYQHTESSSYCPGRPAPPRLRERRGGRAEVVEGWSYLKSAETRVGVVGRQVSIVVSSAHGAGVGLFIICNDVARFGSDDDDDYTHLMNML